MTLTQKIEYDFLLSGSVCKELDETAAILRQNASDAKLENFTMLTGAWRSEASERFTKKYSELLTKQNAVAAEIEEASEIIKTLSKRLYLIEEAAKKTAVEKG